MNDKTSRLYFSLQNNKPLFYPCQRDQQKTKRKKNGNFTSSVIFGHAYRDIVMLVVKRLPNISCYQFHRQNGQVFIFEQKNVLICQTMKRLYTFFFFQGERGGLGSSDSRIHFTPRPGTYSFQSFLKPLWSLAFSFGMQARSNFNLLFTECSRSFPF